MQQTLKVKKRGNRGYEDVDFNKITQRLDALALHAHIKVNTTIVALETIKRLSNNITTEELDIISAKQAAYLGIMNPEYLRLASRIMVSNLHKTTPASFSEAEIQMHSLTSLISEPHFAFIIAHAAELDKMIIHDNDYLYDYIGLKTLEQSYLTKVDEPILDEEGRLTFIRDKALVPLKNIRLVDSNEDHFNVKSYTLSELTVNDTSMDHIFHNYNPIYVGDNANDIKIIDLETSETSDTSQRDTNFHVVDLPCQVKYNTRSRIIDRPQYMHMRVAIAIMFNWLDKTIQPLLKSQEIKRTAILDDIKRIYKQISMRWYTPATPTSFNACNSMQLSSCFLYGSKDAIKPIMKNLLDTSLTSKSGGGIGVHMHEIRCRNQIIRGTNGKSSGLPRQLTMYDNASETWDQGGRRKGAFAIYVEPWHGDILEFLQLKLNEEGAIRCRNLFYALWVPDLFVLRARDKKMISLFSSDTAPGLNQVYDGMSVCTICGYCANRAYAKWILRSNVTDAPTILPACNHKFARVNAFTKLYNYYENTGRAIAVVPAQTIMDAQCELKRESGVPYVCFKDHVNRMTNQANIGTIQSSNLCTEIMEYSDSDSYAVCTLSSINLKQFVRVYDGSVTNNYHINGSYENRNMQDGNTDTNYVAINEPTLIWSEHRKCGFTFDHVKLGEIVASIVDNLDNIVSYNKYPVDKCINNSHKYRPIGIGVQGLANLFMEIGIAFDSKEAAKLDLEIFETIYYHAVKRSVERAITHGAYEAFPGSPASMRMLAPDLWLENQEYLRGLTDNTMIRDLLKDIDRDSIYSGRWDFEELKDLVQAHGMRNSLLIAPMPTVSTAQVLGNNESFEPLTSNLYSKKILGGQHICVNQYMTRDLIQLGLWTEQNKNLVEQSRGSVQHDIFPATIREIYKTVYEFKQTYLMTRAALRQAFIDQSQSLNIHLTDNSNANYRGVFFKGWELGLKTGNYYIKTQMPLGMKTNIVEHDKGSWMEKKIGLHLAEDSSRNIYDKLPVCNMEEGCTEGCSG